MIFENETAKLKNKLDSRGLYRVYEALSSLVDGRPIDDEGRKAFDWVRGNPHLYDEAVDERFPMDPGAHHRVEGILRGYGKGADPEELETTADIFNSAATRLDPQEQARLREFQRPF